jgi:hypothetical protein
MLIQLIRVFNFSFKPIGKQAGTKKVFGLNISLCSGKTLSLRLKMKIKKFKHEGVGSHTVCSGTIVDQAIFPCFQDR